VCVCVCECVCVSRIARVLAWLSHVRGGE